MTELFDAIFAYYVLVLGAGALNGARATLRDAGADPETSAAGDGSRPPGSGGREALVERGRALGARTARLAQALGRSRTARSIAGWASGARVYRTGRRGAQAVAERVVARRTVAPDASSPAPTAAPIVDPAAARAANPGADSGRAGASQGPQAPATAADGDTPPATQQPDPGTAATADAPTAPAQPAGTPDIPALDDAGIDALDALMRVATNPDPAVPTLPSGRPRLTLVPPLKEYPEMPAADITDLESLIGFTGHAASTAGMESEDSIAAAASTTAAAEFAGETARRVDSEVQTVEMAISSMTVLGVDAETSASYHRLHEAGGTYRELANAFAAACQDLTGIAANMASAASYYHEAAVAALDTVHTHQLPHADAAQATGHGGADGQFYGVANTGDTPALDPAGQNALPVGG